MNRERLGVGLMVLGALVVVFGVVGLLSDGGADDDSTAASTAPAATADSQTSDVAPGTSPAPDTAPAVTPTPATTTPVQTTVPLTTTEAPAATEAPAETVETFVELFSEALEAGDFEFIWDRLHPSVIETGGEPTCRNWVQTEIMALSSYRLLEVTGGPSTVSGIPDVYSASVAFDFQGESFEGGGQFALANGVMFWLGVCR